MASDSWRIQTHKHSVKIEVVFKIRGEKRITHTYLFCPNDKFVVIIVRFSNPSTGFPIAEWSNKTCTLIKTALSSSHQKYSRYTRSQVMHVIRAETTQVMTTESFEGISKTLSTSRDRTSTLWMSRVLTVGPSVR